MFAFAPAKACRASEILQDSEGCFDPLLFGFASDLSRLTIGHLPADLAHGGAQLCCAQLSRKHRHNKIKQRTVGFWENLFRVCGKDVGYVWLSKTVLNARLPDQSVSLETQQMRPDRVVSKAQCGGQLVNRALLAAQQFKDFSAGALKQTPSPGGIFHFLKVEL